MRCWPGLTLAPAIIVMAVLLWYPVSSTIRYSFTDWNGAGADWVGLTNYTDPLFGGQFFELIRTNLVFLAAIPPLLLICVVVSVAIHRSGAGLADLPVGLLSADRTCRRRSSVC